MADEIDRAQALDEHFRQIALRKVQQSATVTPLATGECLYCGETVELDRRWCDRECRDLWEREQR